jgi:glycerol-1-phosphate dehydrogenase [NAD(P)+]
LKLHRMQLPREIVVGNETLELIGKICKRLGFSESALVVTGPHTHLIAGQKVIDILDDAGINVDQLIVSSFTVKDVKTVEEKIRELKPQVVLGIGGGTKIDVAKLGSARQEVPFISIPTTASHDGIASSVVSLRGLNKPYSRVAQSPMAIVVDTSVIIQASHRFAASGCGDVLAKFTAVRDWELAHNAKNEYYGEYAASLSLMGAKLVADHANVIQPEIEEGVRVLLEALISCGVAMSIAGSSRPCSGSEHLFSHALDVISPKPAMHGEQCGVGTIMMARLHGLNWKRVKGTLERVGAPTTAEELGIESEHVVKALTLACTIRPERYTILNERKLSYEAAKKLARATGVIE